VASWIPYHFLRIHDPVELLRADEASIHRGVAQVRILFQRPAGDRRSLGIPDNGTKRGHQHEGLTHKFLNRAPLDRDSLDTIFTELDAGVAENARGVQYVVDDGWPHCVQFEVPVGPGKSDGVVLQDGRDTSPVSGSTSKSRSAISSACPSFFARISSIESFPACPQIPCLVLLPALLIMPAKSKT